MEKIKLNKSVIDPTGKLLAGLVDTASNKDADYLEISSTAVKFSINGRLIKLSKKTTPKINQEIIEYLKAKSKLKFSDSSINTANIKLKGKDVTHKLNLKFIKDRFGLTSVLIFVEDPIKITTLQHLGFWGRNLNQIADTTINYGGLSLICSGAKIANKTIYSIATLSAKTRGKIIVISNNPSAVPELENIDVYSSPKTDFASLNLSKLVLRIKPKVLIVEDWLDNPHLVNLMVKLSLGGAVVLAGSENLNPEAVIYELYENFSGSKRLVAEALSLVISLKAIPYLAKHGDSFMPSDQNLKKIQTIFKLKGPDSWSDLATIGGLSFTNKPMFWSRISSHCDDCLRGLRSEPALTTINQCLVVDTSIKRFIEAGDLGRGHLLTRAISRGMLAMHYDGLIKAMRGDIALSDLIELISSES